MNSALVTECGAVTLIGPRTWSCASGEQQGAEHVRDADPAPVLRARAEPATEPQPERHRHLAEGAAAGVEDDAEPGMDDTDARVAGRLGGGFPGLAHVGEEAVAPGTRLGQHLVAAVAVDAHRRCADEDARRDGRVGERSRKGTRRADAAVADPRLHRRCPAATGHALAREMDDGVHRSHRRGVDDARVGAPAVLIGTAWRAAHEADHVVPRSLQERDESRTDEAAGAGDRNTHSEPFNA